MTTLKLDELIRALQIFEMNLTEQKGGKGKSVAFQAEATHVGEEPELEIIGDESITENTKKFRKFFKNINKKNGSYKPGKMNNQHTSKSDFKSSDKIQYRACDGFGHIGSECANTLKRKGKNFNVVCSDDE